MTFVTTNLNTEIITLCLNGLQCVCKILHVDLYMIQRNVFKVYRMDDQIWYTSETLHFQNRGKRGPYWVIFSFLNGDSMAKNCCRRPISLVSRCSSNIFRTNGFSQPFSGKSPNIFPTFSQHFPNIFPTFSQHVPNIFPTFSQHFPNMFPTCSQHFPNIVIWNLSVQGEIALLQRDAAELIVTRSKG